MSLRCSRPVARQGLEHIGRRLVTVEHAVHRYVASILRKFGFPFRAAAAREVRAGLV